MPRQKKTEWPFVAGTGRKRKTIYFATQNTGKAYTFTAAVAKYGIEVIHQPLFLGPEPRIDDVKEAARQKVFTAFEKIRQPVVAIDAGFKMPALGGFPGAYVNFVLQTIGIDGILKLLEEKPRECFFEDCLACYDGREEPSVFISTIKGQVAQSQRGGMQEYAWSLLWLIFIPEGYQKTLGEMSSQEYQEFKRTSDSNSCIEQFAKWFAASQ